MAAVEIVPEVPSCVVCKSLKLCAVGLVLNPKFPFCIDHGGARQAFQCLCTDRLRKHMKVDNLIDIFIGQQGQCKSCGLNIMVEYGNRMNMDAMDVPSGETTTVFLCQFCRNAKSKLEFNCFHNMVILHWFKEQIPTFENYHHFVSTHREWVHSVTHRIADKRQNFKDSVPNIVIQKWSSEDIIFIAKTQQFSCPLTGARFCFCNVPHCPLKPTMELIDWEAPNALAFQQDNVILVSLAASLARNKLPLKVFLSALQNRRVYHQNKQFETIGTACNCQECTSSEMKEQKLNSLFQKSSYGSVELETFILNAMTTIQQMVNETATASYGFQRDEQYFDSIHNKLFLESEEFYSKKKKAVQPRKRARTNI